jgi:hypothetical protein
MADIFDHALEGSTPLQALEVEFSEPSGCCQSNANLSPIPATGRLERR